MSFVLVFLKYTYLNRKEYTIRRADRSGGARGLRRGSSASRLLGMRVRIPPGAWMSLVNVACCQVEVSATSRSLVQRCPT